MPHGVGADEFASLREFCARWRGGLGWGELGKARQGRVGEFGREEPGGCWVRD